MAVPRCTVCNKEADLFKEEKSFCATHYVAVSHEDALYWDLHALLKQDMVGASSQSPRRLLEAIKKKYPHLVQRYYYYQQKIHPSFPIEDDEEEDLSPEQVLALAHERAKGNFQNSK
ncbi:hypothetical protein EXS73_00120 [Candidatus Pacearchaeota archaeon]|nr:hypothetical protein [Candidatus Pacearchaeota archaeon]